MLKELLQKPSSLLISLFVHLFVLLLLWFFSSAGTPPKPKVSAEMKPIQAIALDARQLDQAVAQLKQQEQRVAEEKRAAERKAKAVKLRQAEQRRQEKLKKEHDHQAALQKKRDEKQRKVELKRQVELKKKAAQKRKAAAEKKQQAELARKAKAEKKRQAERVRKAKAEKKQQAELARKAAAEKKQQAELARQQQAKRDAAAKRQAASAAEQTRRNRLLLQYMSDIQQRVMRNWVPPSGGSAGMSCEVSVVQLSSGTIIDFQVANCRGDAAFRRSVESAMGRLMALPLAPERSLFEREVKFKFKG